MRTVWWLSNSKMTVRAVVRDDKIIDASPIIRKFIGQPLRNLVTWMRRIAPDSLVIYKIGENNDALET